MRCVLALLVAATGLCLVSAGAGAQRLRMLAPSTTSFATDGARYAAWQKDPLAAITVLNTQTGTRRAIAQPGCVLEGNELNLADAAAGRFLLLCFKESDGGCFVAAGSNSLLRCGEKPLGEEPTVAESEAQGVRVQRLLDVATGTVVSLPERTYWTRVGTRYVEGEPRYTEGAGACPPRPECVDLYDVQTGVASVRAQRRGERSDVLERVDLELVGAPFERVCRALRGAVKEQLKYGRWRGEGFAFGGGVLAHPTHNFQNVRVQRCDGRSAFLPGPSESAGRYLRRSEPRDFDIGEGLLTWDTGHAAAGADMDEQSNERGTLSSYELSRGKLRKWKLPRLSIGGSPELESPGAYGYSAHTGDFVLWVATRTIYQEGEAGGTHVAISSVYGARL